MARGKYAARAAGTRATAAQESAAELRAILRTERAEHTATVTRLNAEIVRLQGRAEADVHALAKAEIAQAKREAQEAIAALQAEHVAAGVAVHDFFRSGELAKCPEDQFYGRLRDMLGISLSDLDPSSLVDNEEFPLGNRSGQRRMKRALQRLDGDASRRREGAPGKEYHGDDTAGRERLSRAMGARLGLDAPSEAAANEGGKP